MIQRLSSIIAWSCRIALVAAPAAGLFYLFDIAAFADLARQTLRLPVQWQTVEPAQWYGLWLLGTAQVALVLSGLYFLSQSFASFARGEVFNLGNCLNLRRFGALLVVQALTKPLLLAAGSIVLSLNHPPGQRMLAISVGSGELNMIGLGLIFWVLSALLVEACRLHSENSLFV